MKCNICEKPATCVCSGLDVPTVEFCDNCGKLHEDLCPEIRQGTSALSRPSPSPVSDKGCKHERVYLADGHNDECSDCGSSLVRGAWTSPPADAALSEVLSRLLDGCGELPDDEIADRLAILAAFAERVRAEAIEECAKESESIRPYGTIPDRIRKLR